MKLAIRRLDSRQGAKHAKFRSEKINYLEKKWLLLFSDLCGLGVFAGRYSEFQFWLCRAKTSNMVIHRISYFGLQAIKPSGVLSHNFCL